MKYEGNICPNCFDAEYDSGECLKCGFREIYNQRSPRALPGGTILNGRYIVGKVLGEGGFGITYKACDLNGGGICAMKEYAPTAACIRREDGITMEPVVGGTSYSYEAGLERFLEEAEMLHKLGEITTVVKIMDCFKENRTAYFAMEYLDGANLGQILKVSKNRLPLDEITGIIAQVGNAMETVHRDAHIFHCDISPDNIYVTRDKKIKLIDFGSARENERQGKDNGSVTLKLGFAPPEQYSSRMPHGPYTDVYSLAATYYFALTGTHLPAAPARLKKEGYVPLKQANPGIPEYISDAVDAALELNYQTRTQTMRVFVDGITGSKPLKPVCRPKPKPRTKVLPYLEVEAGAMKGMRWNLPYNQELKVGRSRRDNNIAISGHREISNVHCHILFDEGKGIFLVRDVSRNGTFMKEGRMEKGRLYPMKPSVVLALASTDCVIRLGVSLVNIME